MTTHYIPPFTTRLRNAQGAVCGQFVEVKQHSTEPTCPTCKAWLEQDEADAAETIAALKAEFPTLTLEVL